MSSVLKWLPTSSATSEQREPATSISILNQREICSYTSLLLGITSTPRVQGSLCNCLMLTWSHQCPDLMDEVSGKGYHTVRYSSRNWRCTGSDMGIEESAMREAKTSGGIGHGPLRHEDALDLGFSLYATPVKLVKIMLCHFADKLTLLATSFLIQLWPPRPEILWPLKLLLTFLRRIILLIQT